ncbi:hypothetical protein roselon_02807 [Roseibacterium elongatum DSM 19469]|uniref:Uncharacterized protein n=1 Tax=Roseicyclus elongatus DSM 19469 TaxID=1294273 RepID=W8SRE8_9RHOB|nr:hypothetical protein [Roseibacterium elongatum]AHM05105.1 hypothetical protein roselon_02807 [Roseibacterium elongatum DSM 19469]
MIQTAVFLPIAGRVAAVPVVATARLRKHDRPVFTRTIPAMRLTRHDARTRHARKLVQYGASA